VQGSAQEYHRTTILAVLRNPDLLAIVFRSDVATEAIIEALLRLKVVSKDWHAIISCVVVDEKWLGPFCCSAEEFVKEIADLVEAISKLVSANHADESVEASLARKQTNADYYVDQMFAHMFNKHAQYEALGSLAIIVGQIFMQQQTYTKAIAVVNTAMIVHASVQRVQQMSCVVTEILAKNKLNKDALLEAGTLSKILQAGGRFGASSSMFGSIICAVNKMIFSSVTDDGHQAIIQAVIGAGAISIVTWWMWADAGTNQLFRFTDFCLFINSLTRWHATTLLDASAHEIIFGYLANFSDEWWLQWRGMQTLTLLVHFREADAIDFFGDSRGIQLVFACMDSTLGPSINRTEERAIKLLAALVRRYPKTTDHMVGAGLIPLLRKIMTQALNGNRSTVHLNAVVSMLCTIASNVTYRPTMAAADIVPTVCLAMQALESDIMLQTYAITLFGYLSYPNINTHRAMEQHDVIKLVTREDTGIVQSALIAMQNHAEVLSAQNEAIMTLFNCVVAYPRMYASFRQHGGVFLVQRVLDMPDLDAKSKQIAHMILKAC